LGGGAGFAVCLLSGDTTVGWESSASEMWTSDRVGRRFVGSAASIAFAAFFRITGSVVVWLILFPDGATSVMLGSVRGRSRVF